MVHGEHCKRVKGTCHGVVRAKVPPKRWEWSTQWQKIIMWLYDIGKPRLCHTETRSTTERWHNNLKRGFMFPVHTVCVGFGSFELVEKPIASRNYLAATICRLSTL